MLTNKIIANFYFEAIDRDFDIFEVTNELDTNVDINILDINTKDQRYLARSVVYTWGRTCYMMFDKGGMTDVLLRDIFEQSSFDGYLVKKINLSERPNGCFLFYDNSLLLLQLLLNSLSTSYDKEERYNNLTGKLYYFNPTQNKKASRSLILQEICLEKGMTLFPRIVTFRKMPIGFRDQNNTPYIIDKNTSRLRKLIKADKLKEAYFKKGFDGTHASAPYIGFYYQDYEISKAKAMYEVCEDIKENLNKYVKIEFSNFEIESVQSENTTIHSDFEINEVVRRIATKGIRFVNLAGENGKDTLKQWNNVCKSLGIPCRSTSKIDDNKYNIIIIHDSNYYNENNLNDPHKRDYGCAIVQHVIAEHFREKTPTDIQNLSPRYKVVLTELLIKEDVMHSQISLVDWHDFGFDKPISFVTRTPCNSNDVKWNVFTVITIDIDGSFVTKTIKESDWSVDLQTNSTDYSIMECFKTQHNNNDFQVDMVVFEDIDNPYIIRHTGERTIPDVEYIGKQMDKTNPKRKIRTGLILEHLNAFELEYGYSEYCNLIREMLERCGEYISREDLHIKGYKTEKTHFYDYLESMTGEIVTPKIKRKKEDPAQLDNLVGIKYYRTPKSSSGYDSYSYSYTVGSKDYSSFKFSIPKAYLVRQIIRKNRLEPDKDFVEKLLGLMQVGFVKFKENTVLPFPNKYLNEIVKLLTVREPFTFGVNQ